MSEPAYSQDAEHLRLLAIFHYVCAVLFALGACIPIIHLVIGFVMLLSPHSFGPGRNQPPAFIGLFFVIFASIFILLGWTIAALLAWAGRNLSRRKHYNFCFVMACIACLFMPIGTILGVFTILVLMRPSVKLLFDQGTAPPALC